MVPWRRSQSAHTRLEIVASALIYLNKKTQTRALQVLVDTCASASVILGEHCTKLKIKSSPTTTWSTKVGTFTTNKKARLQFVLPEFHQKRKLLGPVRHVDDTAVAKTSQYDTILGHDLFDALGLIINFCNHTMTWEEATTLQTARRWVLQRNIFHWCGKRGDNANDANFRC